MHNISLHTNFEVSLSLKTAAQISLRFYILKLTFPSHMAYGKEYTVLRLFIGIAYDQSDVPLM